MTNAAKAGAIFFVGLVQFVLLVIVSESVSPEFSVSANNLSDLGHVFPASVPIFNSSTIVLGVLIFAGAYFLQKALRWTPLTLLVVLAGVGSLGVGLFPETSPYSLHDISSLMAFLFMGVAAVAASKFQKAPLSYFSVVLGVITLAALLLYAPGAGSFGDTLGIGVGGLESLIVYPTVLWAIAFSGFLMGSEDR